MLKAGCIVVAQLVRWWPECHDGALLPVVAIFWFPGFLSTYKNIHLWLPGNCKFTIVFTVRTLQ